METHIIEIADPSNPQQKERHSLSLSTSSQEVVALLTRIAVDEVQLWLETALFFNRPAEGRTDAFEDILRAAVKHFGGRKLSVVGRNLAAELCSILAGHYLTRHTADITDLASLDHYKEVIAQGMRYDATHPLVGIVSSAYDLHSSKTMPHGAQTEKLLNDVAKKLSMMKEFAKTNTQRIQATSLLAICRYRLEDYVEAWKCFAEVIALTPTSTPSGIRLGLAYCNFKLGQEDIAIKSFRRVLDIDGQNIRANLGLAGILLGYQGDEAHEKHVEGTKLLFSIYNAYKENPVLLNMIASALFRVFYTTRSNSTAEHIIRVADEVVKSNKNKTDAQSKRLDAEAYFQRGRVYHVKEEFKPAVASFQMSVTNNSDHIPALYSMAQCKIYLMQEQSRNKDQHATYRDIEDVIHLLKRCHHLSPDNPDLLSIMAKLHTWKYIAIKDDKSREDSLEAALQLLHGITDVANPLDTEAWGLRGFLERVDTQASLVCYEKQVTVLNDAQKHVPSALLANLAAVYIQDDNVVKATENLRLATEAFNEEKAKGLCTTDHLEGVRKVLDFNAALLDEYKRELQTAADRHITIIKEWPGFLDSYLSLVDLYHEMGHAKKAAALAQLASEVMARQPLAKRCLPQLQLAALYFKMCYFKDSTATARKVAALFEEEHEREQADASSRDLLNLALLLQANGLYALSSAHATSKERRQEELRQAEEIYRKVFSSDVDNVYAVHNLACAMLSRSTRNKQHAKTLIERVREATVPSGKGLENVATFNLAQLSFYERLPAKSLPLYFSLQSACETDPKLEGFVPVRDIGSKVAHCYVFKKDYRSATREFAGTLENSPMSMTASCNLALSSMGAILQDYREGILSDDDALERAGGQLQGTQLTFARVRAELEAVLVHPSLSEKKKATFKAQMDQVDKYDAMCVKVAQLLQEERDTVRHESSVEVEITSAFKNSSSNYVTWREQASRQEEQDRRGRVQSQVDKMAAQEEKLRAINLQYQEEMKNEYYNKDTGATTGSGVPRSGGTQARTRTEGSAYHDANPTQGAYEPAGADVGTTLRNGDESGLVREETTASGRKRLKIQLTAAERKELDKLEDGSDDTDEMDEVCFRSPPFLFPIIVSDFIHRHHCMTHHTIPYQRAIFCARITLTRHQTTPHHTKVGYTPFRRYPTLNSLSNTTPHLRAIFCARITLTRQQPYQTPHHCFALETTRICFTNHTTQEDGDDSADADFDSNSNDIPEDDLKPKRKKDKKEKKKKDKKGKKEKKEKKDKKRKRDAAEDEFDAMAADMMDIELPGDVMGTEGATTPAEQAAPSGEAAANGEPAPKKRKKVVQDDDDDDDDDAADLLAPTATTKPKEAMDDDDEDLL